MIRDHTDHGASDQKTDESTPAKDSSVPLINVHTYIHILYLNTIWFKAQSLWGRVKMITNG